MTKTLYVEFWDAYAFSMLHTHPRGKNLNLDNISTIGMFLPLK